MFESKQNLFKYFRRIPKSAPAASAMSDDVPSEPVSDPFGVSKGLEVDVGDVAPPSPESPVAQLAPEPLPRPAAAQEVPDPPAGNRSRSRSPAVSAGEKSAGDKSEKSGPSAHIAVSVEPPSRRRKPPKASGKAKSLGNSTASRATKPKGRH